MNINFGKIKRRGTYKEKINYTGNVSRKITRGREMPISRFLFWGGEKVVVIVGVKEPLGRVCLHHHATALARLSDRERNVQGE